MGEGVIFLITLLSFNLIRVSHQQLQLFVDGTSGNDNNSGSQSSPFKSIGRAQNYIRGLGGNLPNGGVVVNIRSGSYQLNSPLQLTAQDSGKYGSPVIYSGFNNEKVLLHAGVVIPASSFKPSHGSVLVADLKSYGISDFGDFAAGGLGTCSQTNSELFLNGVPQVVARYPNIKNGYFTFDNIKSVKSSTEITYSDARSATWANEHGFWLHGYWSFDWADSYVRVKSVIASNNTFLIDPSTPPLYGFLEKARYYALNLFSELDVPNEYYIDKANKLLYFIPPAPLTATDLIVLSVGTNVITLNGVSHVQFKNLQVMYSKEVGISAPSANYISIQNCDLSNHGHSSIYLSGANNQLISNKMSGLGCTGIAVSGGDQKTLTPANNAITNNEISNYARIIRTYTPGISFRDIGSTYSGNYVHDAPHSGILGGGNNNLFDGNHLKNLCYEASDSGGFYTGRSWIDRGNKLTNNVFENIYNVVPSVLGWPSIQGAYLDDQMSGWTVTDNKFINCQAGIVLGGGRRNTITGNYFQNCSLAVHFDNRGMNWQNTSCAPGGLFSQQLDSVNYKQPPWSTAYPELLTIYSDHPCVPVHNTVSNNNYCKSPKFLDASPSDITSWMSVAQNNNEIANC